jgi:hypothetical protein
MKTGIPMGKTGAALAARIVPDNNRGSIDGT